MSATLKENQIEKQERFIFSKSRGMRKRRSGFLVYIKSELRSASRTDRSSRITITDVYIFRSEWALQSRWSSQPFTRTFNRNTSHALLVCQKTPHMWKSYSWPSLVIQEHCLAWLSTRKTKNRQCCPLSLP